MGLTEDQIKSVNKTTKPSKAKPKKPKVNYLKIKAKVFKLRKELAKATKLLQSVCKHNSNKNTYDPNNQGCCNSSWTSVSCSICEEHLYDYN